MNERRGERKVIGPLSLKSQRESVRSSDAGSGGPHSALRLPPRPRLHEEVGLPKERAGNPAPRLSLGSASPPPAQPQRPGPHLVSKYTLGGCQESGGPLSGRCFLALLWSLPGLSLSSLSLVSLVSLPLSQDPSPSSSPVLSLSHSLSLLHTFSLSLSRNSTAFCELQH